MINDWWRSLFTRPLPTILLYAGLASTLLGTGESANVAGIQSGLPDIYRLLRVLINFGIFFICLGGIVSNTTRWKYAGAGAKWMLIYALFAVASTLWSISPFISLWKSFEVLNLVLLAIYLAGHIRSAEDIRWLLNISSLAVLYILMTIYAGVLVYPTQGLMSIDPLTGRGYFGVKGLVPNLNPSSVGVFAAIIAISALTPILMKYKQGLQYKNKFGLWLLVVLSIVLLLLCRSRTQMIAFAVSFICILIFSRRYAFALILATLGSAVFIVSEVVTTYFLRGQSFDQFTAFTGRLAWWEKAIDLGLAEAPLLGKGFYAAQRIAFNSNVLDSTFVEVFFGLGLIGLLLLLIPVFIMAFTLLGSRPRKNRFELIDLIWMQSLAIFVVLVVRSITVSTFVSMHPMLIYYLLIQISSAAALRIRNTPSDTESSEDSTPDYVKSGRVWLKAHKQSINASRHGIRPNSSN